MGSRRVWAYKWGWLSEVLEGESDGAIYEKSIAARSGRITRDAG